MTSEEHQDGAERDALFIRKANSARRFIQTIGMFVICVAAAIAASVLNMPGLVATMAAASVVSGTLGFLWIVDRVNPVATELVRVPRVLRSVPAMVVAVILAVSGVFLLSFEVGAKAGLVGHLVVYSAEFALAVAIKARRTSRGSSQ